MLRLQQTRELHLLERPLFLAMGVFDGVHRGHVAVIQSAIDMARAAGGLAGVLTFEPHPIRLLAPERAPKQLLASLEHKARLLERMGLDFLLALNFDAALAQTSAGDFLTDLCASGKLRGICVGEDWRFGRGREGDGAMLRAAAAAHGFTFQAMPPVMHGGERISSTRIRQAIRDGAMEQAAELLGRGYAVEGWVMKGQQLGRTLGFPTANVALGEEQLPPDGVWAMRVRADGVTMNGVANLGFRPTVNGVARVFEVHVFDFDGDLYGKWIECEFRKHLRVERKFSSIDELREQIQRDANQARAFFTHESQMLS